MKSIIVLGAGMVGSAMALDLAKQYKVTVADFSIKALENIQNKNKNITTCKLDVTKENELKNCVKPYDLVLCAVPGFLGFKTLQFCIEAKKNIVDISFFPENALELDKLAKENGVTAVVDCGVAPGMGNIILGYYNEKMTIESFDCLVGGLPKVHKWPFSYKAPFSPVDVIEEYTRPARYIENGVIITKEALSDCEYEFFEGVGTLESFNSDGLRSLLYTMPHIKNMKEKTLRYPNHVEYIKVLKESGFFSNKPLKVNGVDVSPLEFTSKILFNEWYLKPDEEEITVMKIIIKGVKNYKPTTVTYQVHDKYCSTTRVSSMARTTGYTATAAVNLILKGMYSDKGISPPEYVGKYEACFEYILKHLKERNVIYHKIEEH